MTKMALRQRILDAIPTSWRDPLLTGPSKVLPSDPHEWSSTHIEALLLGVQARLIALLPHEDATPPDWREAVRQEQTCATCDHYQPESPLGGHCTDVSPNPMAHRGCGPSFGCVHHRLCVDDPEFT